MITKVSAQNLDMFKDENDKFIYGVEGALRLHFVQEALHSFLPYPVNYCLIPDAYTTFAKCILAVTDKRIMLIGKGPKNTLDKDNIYSFNYGDIGIEYKDKLGSKMFILDLKNNKVYNFLENNIIFEVNPRYYKQGEIIKGIISEYKV